VAVDPVLQGLEGVPVPGQQGAFPVPAGYHQVDNTDAFLGADVDVPLSAVTKSTHPRHLNAKSKILKSGRCQYCLEWGHKRGQCPNETWQGEADHRCEKCHRPGHRVFDCCVVPPEEAEARSSHADFVGQKGSSAVRERTRMLADVSL